MMIDVDDEVLEYSRRLHDGLTGLMGFKRKPGAPPTRYKNCSLFEMPQTWTNRFDLVFAEGTAQHWVDEKLRQGCIDEMTRVSKGIVLIMGNNGLREEEQHVDEVFNFTYAGMPPHRKCFTPDELEIIFVKAGLK